MTTAPPCASCAAISGVRKGPGRGRRRRSAVISISLVASGKRRRHSRSKSMRHAFGSVFEGSGRLAYASKPFGVLGEKQIGGEEILFREAVSDRSLVMFDSGERFTVQARGSGHPLFAGFRKTNRGAGRLVWAYCDEHAGRAATGGQRAARGNLYQEELKAPSPIPSVVGYAHRQPGKPHVITAHLRHRPHPRLPRALGGDGTGARLRASADRDRQ